MRTLTIAAILVGLAQSVLAQAQPAQPSAKQQIVQALQTHAPTVAQLRLGEKVGEANTGLLDTQTFKPGLAPLSPSDQQVVTQVNQLRSALYSELATETGLPQNEVIAIRCSQLHPRLKPGIWFQDPSGTWQNGTVQPPPPPPAALKRILSKPGAAIYAQAGSSQKADDNIPAFSAYPVLSTQTVGTETWYEVAATAQGSPIGWMRDSDLLPWNNRLVMEFTNPAVRQPVLFFRDRAVLESLAGDTNRTLTAGNYQKTAEQAVSSRQPLPAGSPVVAIEPSVSPDIHRELYVMPVLEAPRAYVGRERARLLNIVCAPLSNATDPKNPGFQNVNVDLVFVMDTTGSMQPFLDRVLKVCTAISQQVSDDSSFRFKFGFWGYQDETSKSGILYLTKNFTPQLQDLGSFVTTLSGIKANRATADEYAEDALSGVADAIQDTAWSQNGIRIIIHAGDAPGLKSSTKYGIDARGVRRLADPVDVSIASIHIADPKYSQHHSDAERQFAELADNPGSTSPAFFKAEATDLDKFETQTSDIVKTILGGALQKITGKPSLYGVDPAVVGKVESMMNGAFASYLSAQAGNRAPEVTAWACSRDLTDPNIESLQVGVYTDLQGLNNMISVCEGVLKAENLARNSGQNFFQELQTAVAGFVVNPAGASLSDKGVLSEVANLPYTSTILSLTDGSSQLDTSRLTEIADEARMKLNFYRAVANDQSRWQAPNKSASQNEYVTPIPLDMLP